jgi:alpha-acetolactate decarboxylase
MTERTKTIKGLISGQVDMGTFGLVELELLAIEKEVEELEDNKDKKYTEDDMIKFAVNFFFMSTSITALISLLLILTVILVVL